MTDADGPSSRTRPTSYRELRISFGPPSEVVEVPRALRGLIKPDPDTPSPPAHPSTERTPVTLQSEFEAAGIEFAQTIPPSAATRAAAERERQRGLAQQFADAIEPSFTTGITTTTEQEPTE